MGIFFIGHALLFYPGFSSGDFSLPAGQHHPAVAGYAFQADIRAQPYHFPGISPTGVWLLQLQDIVYVQVREHGWIISQVVLGPLCDYS
jgi:hypothetical protein